MKEAADQRSPFIRTQHCRGTPTTVSTFVPYRRHRLSPRCTGELAEPYSARMGTDQDESGYQGQFNAAVSVIQNLPKSGSYKPSYDEMLRFYSYYKQATIGPCNVSRPGFWDPIGRYKWDAWDRLGRMSREDAMRAYINEMKMVAQKILNTFPLESATPEMFEPFRALYDVIPDMPRPPESFFTGHTENLEYGENQDGHEVKNQPSVNRQQYAFAPEHHECSAHSGQEEAQRREPLGEAAEPAASDSSLGSWGSANEDYSDSLERLSPDKAYKDESSSINPALFQASDVTPKRLKAKAKKHSLEKRKDNDSGSHSAIEVYVENPGGSDVSGEITGRSSLLQLSPQVAAMVQALQATVQGLCQRLESLERALQDQQQVIRGRAHGTPREKKSWHSAMGRSQALFFIFVWPFIVHWLLRRFYGRKR